MGLSAGERSLIEERRAVLQSELEQTVRGVQDIEREAIERLDRRVVEFALTP